MFRFQAMSLACCLTKLFSPRITVCSETGHWHVAETTCWRMAACSLLACSGVSMFQVLFVMERDAGSSLEAYLSSDLGVWGKVWLPFWALMWDQCLVENSTADGVLHLKESVLKSDVPASSSTLYFYCGCVAVARCESCDWSVLSKWRRGTLTVQQFSLLT